MIAVVCVVASAALAAYVVLHESSRHGDAHPATVPFATSPFVFHAAAAPGWWRGGSQDVSEYRDSYITLHQTNDDTCFVDISKHSGASDEAVVLQKAKDKITDKNSGLHLHAIGTSPAVLKTGSQAQNYSLNSFSISGDDHAMRGVELGYIPFSSYYLLVQGWCSTPEQLGVTLPALEAITFTDTRDGG